jgi:hypothetical protein
MMQRDEVKRIKALHTEAILAKPNVVGVGTGYKVIRGQMTDDLCIVAMVRQKIPKAGLTPQALVPKVVDSVATDVVEVGEIRALQAHTGRWRPALGGVSIGHYQITAGTLGAIVRDRATGERLILSNNHVLANSNNANPGDPIIQPGAADGGRVEEDTIAHLVRFCPIEFTVGPGVCDLANAVADVGDAFAQLLGSKHRLQAIQADPTASNEADAAVARPENDDDVLDNILKIGEVSGTAPATLGMPIRKSGRTTEFTTGEITVLDATVNVSYGPGRTARFEGQIVSGPMSQGGDSGSLVVAGDSLQAVGLLFAGSEQSTIFSPIQAVLDCLAVDI